MHDTSIGEGGGGEGGVLWRHVTNKIQSNLSIMDMVYSERPAIEYNFSWNQSNDSQTLIEKPIYSGHFYSGHYLLAPREKFKPYIHIYS